MAITITLPDELERQLQRKANMQRRSVEQVAIDILSVAIEVEEVDPTPEEVVIKIRATPPNSRSVRSASGSLVEALRNACDDPDFDIAAWNQEWAAVEAEMDAMTRANEIAEGRG